MDDRPTSYLAMDERPEAATTTIAKDQRRPRSRLPPAVPDARQQAEHEAEGLSGGVAWRRTGEDDGRVVGAAPGPCQCTGQLAGAPFAAKHSSSVRGCRPSSQQLRESGDTAGCGVYLLKWMTIILSQVCNTQWTAVDSRAQHSDCPASTRTCRCWCLLHSGPSEGSWRSEHLKYPVPHMIARGVELQMVRKGDGGEVGALRSATLP